MERVSIPISDISRNRAFAPHAEGYGIEVEVEGFDRRHWAKEARALTEHWDIKEDGSLRNNGAEFVSHFLLPDQLKNAVHHLYARTRKLWTPSPRTGIHVHANCLHLTTEQVRRICTYYAFAEPLLFMWAGEEREENIFCVPWYRAHDEADLVARALESGSIGELSRSCKYSALYLGPLLTFGTIEFRQSVTHDTPEDLLAWLEVVKKIARSHELPDPIELYAEHGEVGVVRTLLDTLIEGITDRDIESLLGPKNLNVAEVALLFESCTYNYGEWGEACTFYSGSPEQMDDTPQVRLRVEEHLDDDLMVRLFDEPEELNEYDEEQEEQG